MAQSKLWSLIEGCTNIAIGYTIAVTGQVVIFPFFDIDVPLTDNLMIGGCFTVISVIRLYVVRRLFNRREV